MESLRPQEPITADELRSWMEEGEIPVSDATFEGILESLQPRRAKLREAGLSSRSAMIRGAKMAFERQSAGMPVLPPEARPPRPIHITSEVEQVGPTRPISPAAMGVGAVLAGGAFMMAGLKGILLVVGAYFAIHQYRTRGDVPTERAEADREFARKASGIAVRGLLVWISAVMFLFALMSLVSGPDGYKGCAFFVFVGVCLLFVAVTGMGLSSTRR